MSAVVSSADSSGYNDQQREQLTHLLSLRGHGLFPIKLFEKESHPPKTKEKKREDKKEKNAGGNEDSRRILTLQRASVASRAMRENSGLCRH